jgi:D-glycero-D-manno-heptose 1,7-bisphosphate phosphatase
MDATKRHQRTVFLDRDGVINEPPPDPGWVMRWKDFRFARGALDALKRLHEANFTVAVVTNQSCVRRGLADLATIQNINEQMVQAVAEAGGRIAGVYFCPHIDGDLCECRKPKPGLIDQAASDLGLDPSRAFLVGDSERDILAGQARGCTTLFVKNPYERLSDFCHADFEVKSLRKAVDIIVPMVEQEEAQ